MIGKNFFALGQPLKNWEISDKGKKRVLILIKNGTSHMLHWGHQRPYSIKPQGVHMPALCKLVLWLVKVPHLCIWTHQSEAEFTQRKHKLD